MTLLMPAALPRASHCDFVDVSKTAEFGVQLISSVLTNVALHNVGNLGNVGNAEGYSWCPSSPYSSRKDRIAPKKTAWSTVLASMWPPRTSTNRFGGSAASNKRRPSS